jgi:alcohol dehydrogenase class IV
MESLWSVKSDETSREYARRSLALSSQSLESAVNDPRPTVRRSMAEAALLAGRAIDISFTTAPHALSYALTARFGVAHGLAVALTLGAMLEFNVEVTDADVTDERGASFVRDRLHEIVDIIGCTDPPAAAAWLRSLLESVGLPVRLRDVGVKTADLDGLAGEVNAARLANNPRELSPSTIRGVLEASL